MEYKKTFRNLIVWTEAKKIVLLVYTVTKKFPAEERFGISSQLRRASCSVLANIAEGNTRQHKKDKYNFLNIAQGSLVETDCFIEICKELKYINQEEYEKALELINKTAFLLWKLMSREK